MSDNAGQIAAPGGTEVDEAEAAPEAGSRKMAPRTRALLIGGAVVLAAIGIAWAVHYETRGKYFEETDDATIQADAVTISSKVSGYVDAVLVAENQDVRAGQPLVRIDARTYNAQIDQAKAQIAQADAGIESARASIEEQRAAIAQARAQLAAAQDKAAHDAAEAARYAPLAASGAETRQQLALLRSTARQSADAVRAQEANVAMQERRIGTYLSQVKQGQAQSQGARAQLASAQTDVGSTQIAAPFAGRIGNRTVTLGQLAQPGTRLMTLVPLDRLYVTANFKETQLALMRPGQPVTISVDALSGLEIPGRVASIAPGTGAQFSILPPQNATGNFTKIVQRVPVRIAIEASPSARALLVPGMSVTARVDTISAKDDLDRLAHQQTLADKQAR